MGFHFHRRITQQHPPLGRIGENLGAATGDHIIADKDVVIDATLAAHHHAVANLGRPGNANLTTIIPTLLLKEPFASRFETGITSEALSSMVRVSRTLDDILRRMAGHQAKKTPLLRALRAWAQG